MISPSYLINVKFCKFYTTISKKNLAQFPEDSIHIILKEFLAISITYSEIINLTKIEYIIRKEIYTFILKNNTSKHNIRDKLFYDYHFSHS